MKVRKTAFVPVLAPALLASSSAQTSTARQARPSTPASGQATAQQTPAPAPDPLAEMRDDLNRLESLNNVMSSEVELLRDQNLQILLRTNSQMWTVLVRDLRRQIDREEQRQAGSPKKNEGIAAKPEPR